MAHDDQIAAALWQAWMELNAIRARDGVPYMHDGYKASVDEGYFSKVVDDCADAYKALTGREIMPWHPLIDKVAQSPDASEHRT